jgi:DNA-binding response OmpR family regulator
LEAINLGAPDLVVLDLKLPDVNGMEVCRRIRQNGLRMPILILTVEDDILTTVLGFESGADDYVTKPFDTQVLLARIRRHTARHLSTVPGQAPIILGDSSLRIDVSGGRAWSDGAEVELTSKEFEILVLLSRNPDQVVSRERLLEEVWQLRPDVTTRTVDTHIANLRRKLKRNTARPECIVTVHGRGYKLATARGCSKPEPRNLS